MKRIIYILILFSAFALNLEVKAEWENHKSFKNTMFIDTTYGKIIDYKIVEDKTIWAITENNQILSYDLETGNIISHCQCEFDTIPSFKEVSSDGKTTSFAFFNYNYRNEDFEIFVVDNSNCKSVNYVKMNLFKVINLENGFDKDWILAHINQNRNQLFTKCDYIDSTLYININLQANWLSGVSTFNITTGVNGYFEITESKLKQIFVKQRFNQPNNLNTYFFNSKNFISKNNYFYGYNFGLNSIIENEYNIFTNNLETKAQIRNIDRNNIVNLVNDSTMLLYNFQIDSTINKPIFRLINYNINTQNFDTVKVFYLDLYGLYELNNKNEYSINYRNIISQSTFFIDEYNLLHYESGILNLNLPDSLFNDKYINFNKILNHQNISKMNKYELRKLNGFYNYFYLEKGKLHYLKTIEANTNTGISAKNKSARNFSSSPTHHQTKFL